MLFHGGFGIFSGGFVGVDVFFVISGYLITGIIISELDRGTFSIARFYERRARRILPALFFVILACLPFAWAWMPPSQFEDFGKSIIAVSLFGSNILFWRQSGYFEPSADEAPLLHTWSLAVEEQYYVLFPLLLLLAWRFGRNPVFWIIAGTAALSLMVSEWGSRYFPAANFYLAPGRAWELLAGSLCAFVRTDQAPVSRQLLAGLGLGLIVLAILMFDSSTPFPSLYALVPVGGTVLIILFGTGTRVAALLSHRLLVGIGLISYSAYLWHQPLFAFARIHTLLGQPSQVLMLGLAGLSLVLAYGSWRFIEQPFRHRSGGLRPAPWGTLGASALALGLFLAAGVAIDRTKGFLEARADGRQRDLYATASSSPYRDRCHTEGADFRQPDAACTYFTDDVEFAVLGDSHAVELTYAMAALLERDGIGVKQLTFSACGPSYRGASIVPHCAEWTDLAIESLLEDDRIENVVLSYRILGHLFDGHRDVYPGFPDGRSDAERRATWSAYMKALQTLVDAGKNVVLVLQAPELPMSMDTLIYQSSGGDGPLPGVSRDWWAERAAYVQQRLGDIPAGVITIDPADSFCDRTTCFAARGGTSYYFDDNHMSIAGAGIIARQILDLLEHPPPLEDAPSTVMRGGPGGREG